ncbi:CrcB family protein [Propionimicrobium sp. PCR01-08-3]|uniref:fluoride efflux transporter FluC n=1 Tax=Propionimicrobium sp. PCR01-08-3 TaxID=3052086 RepID=UPI00255CE50A|nr:CrcB family protein [Propionimicrobium sp. PCR01-08-3]WIY82205.1 CrcB family protein [Propionimicrobium sp. PCR01-08-3]
MTENRTPQVRPPHLCPLLIILVMVGGACGTAIRNAIENAFTASGDHLLPWATFAINISGAFLLGLLSELLTLLIADEEKRRKLQLTFGTGVLGGFTTYSTFVLETVRLGETSHLIAAFCYAAISIALGFAVAYLAMIGTRWTLAQKGQRR